MKRGSNSPATRGALGAERRSGSAHGPKGRGDGESRRAAKPLGAGPEGPGPTADPIAENVPATEAEGMRGKAEMRGWSASVHGQYDAKQSLACLQWLPDDHYCELSAGNALLCERRERIDVVERGREGCQEWVGRWE
jgi:hypothetical protein